MKLDYYYDPKNDLIFESEEHFKDYKKTKISFSSSKFKPEDFGLSIIEIESPDKPNTDILKKEIFEDIYEKDGKYYLKVSIVDITQEEKNNLEKEKKLFIQGEVEYWEKEIDLMTPKLQYPVDKYDLRTEEEINSLLKPKVRVVVGKEEAGQSKNDDKTLETLRPDTSFPHSNCHGVMTVVSNRSRVCRSRSLVTLPAEKTGPIKILNKTT